MGNMHLQVNERVIDWDDEESPRQPRKALKCEACGSPKRRVAPIWKAPNGPFQTSRCA